MNEILEAEARGRAEGIFAAQEAVVAVVKTGEFDWQEILDTLAALLPEPPDARPWLPIRTAPQDGTEVIVSDGKGIWISAQRVGKYAGPSRNRMPTTGHEFYVKPGCGPPRFWMPKPTLPLTLSKANAHL